jgi:hypothetical protein
MHVYLLVTTLLWVLLVLLQDALHGDCEGLRRFMDRDVDCAERFVGLIRRSAGRNEVMK